MTQPKIDWESAGKAAGAAEKNTAPGLASTRPREWKPNSGQLSRSHESTRKFNASRALDRKLDAVLGPVTGPRVPDAVRFCKCGCGEPVSVRAQYTAECKKRVRAARYKTVTGTPHRERSKRQAGVPDRKPVKRCPVCSDLSERREAICKGCNRPWAKERL